MVPGDVAVLSVVALQTRGIINKKMLGHLKNHVLTGPLPGAVLFIYPHIPSVTYGAKRTVSGEGLGVAAASGANVNDMSDDSDSSRIDDLNEDCQLPEVVTKSVTTMSRFGETS